MIDYFKVGILAVCVFMAFAGGWALRNRDYMDYKKEIANAAKTQEAHVESITKQQALVTKSIEKEYDAKLALLRSYYANGMRQPNTSSLPTNSGIAPKPFDVSSAYSILIGQCAETTQQLVSLQEFLNEQMGIK
jgi:hypothetical protein